MALLSCFPKDLDMSTHTQLKIQLADCLPHLISKTSVLSVSDLRGSMIGIAECSRNAGMSSAVHGNPALVPEVMWFVKEEMLLHLVCVCIYSILKPPPPLCMQ